MSRSRDAVIKAFLADLPLTALVLLERELQGEPRRWTQALIAEAEASEEAGDGAWEAAQAKARESRAKVARRVARHRAKKARALEALHRGHA